MAPSPSGLLMTISLISTGSLRVMGISRSPPGAAGDSWTTLVTIDLGKKVAVKKVTIKVTLVAGQNGAKPEFTTITQIEFLKAETMAEGFPRQSPFTAVTWKKYFVRFFNRTSGSADFKQSGGNLTGTSTVIAGLTNGTKYEVAVKAGNNAGVGPYSAIASGTPEREESYSSYPGAL